VTCRFWDVSRSLTRLCRKLGEPALSLRQCPASFSGSSA
jgi:hypothetical protein